MWYSAETINMLISHLFLECFVKIAFFQNSSIQASNLCKIFRINIIFLIGILSKNQSEIDIFGYSGSDPISERFGTQFWSHFGTIFGAFGVSWGPLAPILAARGPPRPLPRDLLGSLGMSEDLQTVILIDLEPTWIHFGGPGPHFKAPGSILEAQDLHFGNPRAPFWTPQDPYWKTRGFLLEPLGSHFCTAIF